ncbi:MAG: MBL fold metallo-hydrolase [Candidatus Omnitrophica bacterium]|nr:MBL fold metallo-hydrolase [Candidatus Omnitrophota bacterium]
MNFIKFLGTAGARFVMISQLRYSGGIFFSIDGTSFIVDPGPGTLIRAINSRPKLNISKIDGIFLSHRHLDHSCEINLMIEVMTEGGFKKRGIVFAPSDCLFKDPVILLYCRDFPEKIQVIEEEKIFYINNLRFEIPVKHRHGVETYGFKLKMKNKTISYIPDTEFFPELIDRYKGSQILILNTVLYEKRENIQHLCLLEAEQIIKNIKPEKAILTHFGMSMLKNKIWEKKDEISERVGTEVIIANDGMNFEF